MNKQPKKPRRIDEAGKTARKGELLVIPPVPKKSLDLKGKRDAIWRSVGRRLRGGFAAEPHQR